MGLDDEGFEVAFDVTPRKRVKIVDLMILIAVCACYFAVIGNALRWGPARLELMITSALVGAAVARYKGRVWWRWLLVGFFLGPLGLVVFCSSPRLRAPRMSLALGPDLTDEGEPERVWDEVEDWPEKPSLIRPAQ